MRLGGPVLRLRRPYLRLAGPVFRLRRPNLRLIGSVFRLHWACLGLGGTHLGLTGSYLLLAGPGFRLVGPDRLRLWAIVWLSWVGFRLSRSDFGLHGTGFGLAWAVDGVGTRNAGLCGDWPRSGDHCGSTLVDVVELGAVLGGCALVLDLRRHGRSAWTTEGCDLRGLRTDSDAAVASVIGDAGAVVDDDGAVIDVSDVDVHAIDRAVVVEVVSVPVAAVIAVAGVSEAVVDASVEADVKTPVAVVEAPAAVIPTPVTGGPESTIVGGSTPGSWNPVITGGRPVPVARGPDVIGCGGDGLVVFREGWWRLVGILGWLRLTFLVELVEGLGVLIGLILIRGRRRDLIWRGLLWVLFGGLLRCGLRVGSENPSLCGRGGGDGGWLGCVGRSHVRVGGIGAVVIRCRGGVGVYSVAASRADERCDGECKT